MGLFSVFWLGRGRRLQPRIKRPPTTRKTGPISLHPNTAIYRAISHGNMAQKAVRWQPGRQGSFAHTFPEEPTGELNYGAS